MAKATRRPKRADKLQRNLMGQKELLGMSYEDLAAAVGMCKVTTYRLMQQPENMTISQLQKFCRALHLTAEDVRGLIPLA